MITKICKDLMKHVFKSMLSGKLGDVMKMRSPAYSHCPKTFLDCVRYEISYLEEFILLGNKKGVMSDPVERLKYISVAQLACIGDSICSNGLLTPLNPILGETACYKT